MSPMNGKDVETRLKQNIQFLRDRSGSGQVPPPSRCDLLDEHAYFLAQACDMALGASESARGMMARIQALERQLAAIQAPVQVAPGVVAVKTPGAQS